MLPAALAIGCWAAAPPKPTLVYRGAFVIPTPDSLDSISMSPDGTRIAVTYGGENGEGEPIVKVYVIDTHKPKRRVFVLSDSKVNGTAWSPDGKTLAVASTTGLSIVSGRDSSFRKRFMRRLRVRMRHPMLFSERGDWLLGKAHADDSGAFVSVRFDKLPAPIASQVHLNNAYSPSLIRFTDNRIAVVGQGVAVDKAGKEYKVRSAGTLGLYNVHSAPVIAGRWFVTYDMDTASVNHDEVFVVTGTRAWLEDVLTGKRLTLKWPKGMRVSWVQATGPYSIVVQADAETLLSGKFDRFRRYRVVWPAGAPRELK